MNTFGDCSGLKLNVSKSQAMWLGKTANRKDMPFDVKWPQRPICALGTVFFSYNRNLCEAENFTSNINKLRYLCYRTPRCQEKLPQIQLDMHPCKTILHLSLVVI